MRLSLLGLLGLLLLAMAPGASAASAAAASSSTVGDYEREPRLQLEADVPLATIGRARNFVAEARVSDMDELDLQFVLRRDPEAVAAMHEVRASSFVWCIVLGIVEAIKRFIH